MQEKLEIGQIVNTFGVKGEIKVNPFTKDINRFDNLKNVYVKNKKESKNYVIENVRYHKNFVLLKLKGIDTLEQAELLRDSNLEIDRCDAIPLDEGEYFIVDLIGLEVYSDENEFLGKLEDIFNTGSNDIYVIKDELGKQMLIPAISEVIKKIDIAEGKIIVHLIEGLAE